MRTVMSTALLLLCLLSTVQGHARKLVTDTKASKSKINKAMDDVKGKESQKSHQKGVQATSSPVKEMKHEIGAERYPDAIDIAGMDYSPARRRSPIHN
ncbi:hypothetical protein QJS04_geneDACA005355 [Acorus gramineus]|uniref:Uncharacterized protein n=1 Tax=Acorus gramineus TaxID=55184 RepID=A0AAV9AVH9_ACOGR|nr:hypothetical protein QJS04_geneDACA005355 [Acorus gramineus]